MSRPLEKNEKYNIPCHHDSVINTLKVHTLLMGEITKSEDLLKPVRTIIMIKAL